MSLDVLGGDVNVRGALSAQVINYPAGSIVNADVNAAAAIAATKLQQQRNITYQQLNGANAAAESKQVYRVNGATATLQAFKASCVGVPGGDRTCTIDLHKNGVSILSATIQLDSGSVAYTAESGTFSSTSLVAGDVLTVVVTVGGSSGTHVTGLLVNVVLAEDPA